MFENLQLPGESRDKAYTHCCWCFPLECAIHFTGIACIIYAVLTLIALPNVNSIYHQYTALDPDFPIGLLKI